MANRLRVANRWAWPAWALWSDAVWCGTPWRRTMALVSQNHETRVKLRVAEPRHGVSCHSQSLVPLLADLV